MNPITAAAQQISNALKLIPDLPHRTDPAQPPNPPSTVLGPRQIRWEDMKGPSSARFIVYVLELNDEHTLERLDDWALIVADAIDRDTDGAVIEATPGVYLPASAQIPCLEFVVEVPLNG